MKRVFSVLLSVSILTILLLPACSPAPEPPASPSPSSTPTPAPVSTAIPPSWDGLADPALWQGGADYLLTARDGGLDAQANKISPYAYMEETGIELYAISAQNEPQFNQPYASALLPADKMAQVLAVTARRFAAEGIRTKLFMPEALPQQKGMDEYIAELDRIPEASQGTDIIAIHNYDSDGINVGGAGAQEWAEMYQWANATRPRQMWMTETSGHPNTWSGATLLFGNIYNALAYGNASAWVWWTLAETSGNAGYGLVVDNRPTARYAISRHFYRAIQPGAARIQVTAPADLLALAFENPDNTISIVLYNKGQARLVACPDAGTLTEAWFTHEGLLSRPAQVSPAGVLLPADAVLTLACGP